MIDVGAVAPTAEKTRTSFAGVALFLSALPHPLALIVDAASGELRKLIRVLAASGCLEEVLRPAVNTTYVCNSGGKGPKKLDTLGRENIADYAYSYFHFATRYRPDNSNSAPWH